MEAKVREVITLKNEGEFFDLIEKKMREQGFEVLETLSPKEEKKPKEASQSHAIGFVMARVRKGRLAVEHSRSNPTPER